MLRASLDGGGWAGGRTDGQAGRQQVSGRTLSGSGPLAEAKVNNRACNPFWPLAFQCNKNRSEILSSENQFRFRGVQCQRLV